MSCKTLVKEQRKTSVACDACKRRKGKCSGTIPCTHCKDSGIECSYLKGNKKRGPISKKRKMMLETEAQLTTAGLRERDAFKAGYKEFQTVPGQNARALAPGLQHETALSNDAERSALVELYLDQVSTASEKELLILKRQLTKPKTIAQQMRAYSMMGFMARGFGQVARAEQFIGDARMCVPQVMELRTAEVAEAFVALSGYFPIYDSRNVLYLSMAHAIAKTLAIRSGSQRRLYNFSLIGSVILDSGMDLNTKRQILSVYSPKLRETIREPCLNDALIASVANLFCHMTPDMLSCMNIKKMHKLKEIHLSKEDGAKMLEDVDFMEQMLVQHERSSRKGLIFAVRVTKMIILWRCGDLEAALREADSAIEWEHFDAVKYMYGTVRGMDLCSHLLQDCYHTCQLEKADIVFNMFTIISKLYGQAEILDFLHNPTTQRTGATLSELIEEGSPTNVPSVHTVSGPTVPSTSSLSKGVPATTFTPMTSAQQGLGNLDSLLPLDAHLIHLNSGHNNNNASFLFSPNSTHMAMLYQPMPYISHLAPTAPPSLYSPPAHAPHHPYINTSYRTPLDFATNSAQHQQIDELGLLDELFSL